MDSSMMLSAEHRAVVQTAAPNPIKMLGFIKKARIFFIRE